MPSASLRPLEDMQRRLDGARHDSDVALFYDLLGYGELLTKLVVLALVAAIEDDDRQQRYRLEYHLVRTHSIGTWGGRSPRSCHWTTALGAPGRGGR